MTTICPKCRTVRPVEAAVPDWQCPACGVAYAKGAGEAAVTPSAKRSDAVHRSGDGMLAGVPWGKLLAGLAIVYGGWLGYHKSGLGTDAAQAVSRASHMGSDPSAEQLSQLAASAQVSDVLMYSATWCPNCAAAKGWMEQYGFKAQVCEVDKDSSCLSALKTLDPEGGVPYLIVKGHHMKEGFDSDEFIAALGK
jgi:glutaredoxin